MQKIPVETGVKVVDSESRIDRGSPVHLAMADACEQHELKGRLYEVMEDLKSARVLPENDINRIHSEANFIQINAQIGAVEARVSDRCEMDETYKEAHWATWNWMVEAEREIRDQVGADMSVKNSYKDAVMIMRTHILTKLKK